MQEQPITIIGGGLAGCEAAWQAVRAGKRVVLWEMKPKRFSPAHHSAFLAELVCSNSLRAESLENAVGLLKEEMREMFALFMDAADNSRIPAGGALAVDREYFSARITATLITHPGVTLVREEVKEIPADRPLIIASGPLTADALAHSIQQLIGEPYLSFFDAISPVVGADSINMAKVFWGSRYNRGDSDYLNCPLTREEYYHLVDEIIQADQAPGHDFDESPYFEGCLPVEEMASRGKETLAYGPMKPVGLIDPRSGKTPFAVVQLRAENKERTLFNLVGFQTRMRWNEQKRVFRLIPGLENAEFVRLGSCHRNSFLHAPRVLRPTLQFLRDPGIFFAGQITGVEGYVESAATGMVAGINASRMLDGKPLLSPPQTTAIGSLLHHLSSSNPDQFQPMNVNFAVIFPFITTFMEIERLDTQS